MRNWRRAPRVSSGFCRSAADTACRSEPPTARAQSAALGFTVRHDWSDASGLSDRVLSSIVREQSLSRSNCGVTFETAEDGRYMVNADGETLKNIAMHVPRRLGAETAGVFDELNGHPGLEEIVYYNEHGYHTWHVRGLADYSKHTLRLYRDWLKERYRDISALNRLYGTNCRDFSGIEPPRKFTGPSAAWFDWMEFRRYSVAQYFREAYSLIKPHLPDTPITPKPINFDYYAVSTAADPWLLRDACDVYGYDIYPFQREGYLDPAMSLDFHRTQVGERPLKFLESNFEFRRVNQTEKSPADMHLLYMPAFLRGLKGVYFYCWHQAWTQNHRGFWLCGPDGVLTPQGRGAAQVAKAAQTLAPVLMTGRVPPATAAVYFPWEEISQTPNVAPISAMRGAYKLMTQLHYPTDIISHHNIAAGELTRYRVLLLPLSRHLRPETAQRIAEFVRAGGILIAEYQAGRFDQFHRETDSLRGLLGGKSLGTTDAFKSFDAGDDKGIRLYAPITKETPFGWAAPPERRADRPGRKNRRRRRCGNTGPLPGRLPGGDRTDRRQGAGALLCRDLLQFVPELLLHAEHAAESGDARKRDHQRRRPGVPPAAPRHSSTAAKCVRRCGRRSVPTMSKRTIRHSRFSPASAMRSAFSSASPTGGRTSGMRLHSKRMSHLKSGGSL